jgi:sulfur transfer complex TusBCD TusB component (DsrH family)
MIWDEKRQNKDMLAFVKKLNSLYKQYTFFQSTNLKWLSYTKDVLVYMKDDVVIAINKGRQVHSIKDLPKSSYIDLFTNKEVKECILNPKTFMILK